NKTYAYHVFSGEKNPSRDKVIALGFGFQMSVEDMQRLLRFSGNRALYPRDKRDSVIRFAVNKAKDIISCNVLLNDLGLNVLD
ncbi:MAG TPA: XRE family transcriptional regulator, partial [Negativicutes bacterium]|nr:XRE family transcriptional regulator [Negativicutes bacterium]